MFSTQRRSSVLLITFQNYSDSKPWLWTPDFDCYKLNKARQLSLIDYSLKSIPWTLAEFRHNRIMQSPHQEYFKVCREHEEK